MSTLYKNIIELCDIKQIKPGRMCSEAHISRGLISDLKAGRKKSIQIETAQKIADYFNVPVDRVLGYQPKKESPPQEARGELSPAKLAFIDKLSEISDDDLILLNGLLDSIIARRSK